MSRSYTEHIDDIDYRLSVMNNELPRDRLRTIQSIVTHQKKKDIYYPTPTTKLLIDNIRKFITLNQCIKGKWYKVNPTINDYGYLVYQVRKGNKIYNQYLHVLVYKTVNKDHITKEGYHYVFKDGNKCNVHPSNLDYQPIGDVK